MGQEFINRSLKTSGIVHLIFLPFGLYYFGLYPTLAIFSGGVWGLLNLIFLSSIIKATITAEGPTTLKAIGLALFQLPLLYVSGYFLLKVPQFEALYLVAGFTSILLIMVLKVMGRAVLDLDGKKPNSGELEKII